jgi:hypothetical protein
MRKEAFDAAATSFEAAVAIDPSFDMAYYMLGRAHLQRKQYAAAIYALTRCRDLHAADAMRQSTDKQESQRLRREQITDLERLIAEVEAAAALPQNSARRFSLLEQVHQAEAEKAIKAAERAGLTVAPALKDEVKKRRGGGNGKW